MRSIRRHWLPSVSISSVCLAASFLHNKVCRMLSFLQTKEKIAKYRSEIGTLSVPIRCSLGVAPKRQIVSGQPVLIGGTMGTCSYVLTGTEQGMTETFGTTCHGAVRFELVLRWKTRKNTNCLGTGYVSSEIAKKFGLSIRSGQIGSSRHFHSSRLPEVGHGRGVF